MKPSIGRIVHYVMPGGEHRAAIITFVHSVASQVNLHVFSDGPRDRHPLATWQHGVPVDEKGTEPETWHWPERE